MKYNPKLSKGALNFSKCSYSNSELHWQFREKSFAEFTRLLSLTEKTTDPVNRF